MTTAKEYRDTAEQYVDSAGLDNALGGLVQVCYEKAEHVRSTWQDEMLARHWERAASIIAKAETALVNRGLTFR